MSETSPQPLAGAQDEVAELLSDLIRIDTTNTGDTTTSAGERAAAEWVACKLADVALYDAKRGGRGRVGVSGASEETPLPARGGVLGSAAPVR